MITTVYLSILIDLSICCRLYEYRRTRENAKLYSNRVGIAPWSVYVTRFSVGV